MSISQPPPIGDNIYDIRSQKKMSLDELSKKSGVSKSMLSQIEKQKTNPTVITAWKIARALSVDVEKLLQSCDNTAIEVIRGKDAPVIKSSDNLCTIRINTPIHMADNLEIYYLILKPSGEIPSSPHYPDTEEFLTVISGKLHVESGSMSTDLESGDTARYHADRSHKIQNRSSDTAEAYLVVYFNKQSG